MKHQDYHIKKNDTVKVIAGKDKGKSGKVLRVIPKKERAIVEKLNIVKRHLKPSRRRGRVAFWKGKLPFKFPI